jgi:hypothetical protein
MVTVPAAFPFIEVRIDTSALRPAATRATGVIAIVGRTPADAAGGTAPVNTPLAIDTLDQAADLFAQTVDGDLSTTPLYRSLRVALLQDPKPSKIYGVRIEGNNYAAGLAALEAADDVNFVALAEETNVGALGALKTHVESMSSQGQKRIGVGMIEPGTPKAPTYVTDVVEAVAGLRSDVSRMLLVAARGASTDAACASMAAVAGYPPHVSIVLKQVRGVRRIVQREIDGEMRDVEVPIPTELQYSPSEIKGLSEAGIIPIIDPALIVGESLHFAEGRTFTTDASLLYIDIVRTLDDIEFRLKAGLIGLVGDARITKAGTTRLKVRTEGILGPLQRNAVIDAYTVDIPVLNILSIPESAWTATDQAIVVAARANRTVDMLVTITYGPAVHRLLVTLAPKF